MLERRISPTTDSRARSEPWRPSDVGQASTIDYAIETSAMVITTLRNVGTLSTVPFLSNAASIALQILTVVQELRGNQDGYMDLARDACGLVYTVTVECEDLMKNGDNVPQRVQTHILGLVRNLTEIEEYTTKKLKRNGLKKLLSHSRDIAQIARYRGMLRQSLDLFGIQTTLSIQQNLQRLLDNIKEQREEITADRLKRDEQERLAKEERATRLEILRIQEEDRAADEQRKRVRMEQRAVEIAIQEERRRKESEKLRRAKAAKARLEQESADESRAESRRKPSPQPYSPPYHPGLQPPPTSPYAYLPHVSSPYLPAPSPFLGHGGGISFNNINGSAISLGPGVVPGSGPTTFNYNSGNTTTTTMENCNNTYSRPYCTQ
ncbi:hypothetical protein BDZ97DRAFT_1851737 [Flammula alnicola]|nr:hypothetical protein BDZ97DRAFT_1851737 [Flammula alnicola]